MGRPAARVTDWTVCPRFTGKIPHIGGPIIPPCCPTVIVGGLPQARVTDKALCVAGGAATIVTGSKTVFVGGQPAARLGDRTDHRGRIVTGCFNVFIGDSGGSGGGLSSPEASLARPDREPERIEDAAPPPFHSPERAEDAPLTPFPKQGPESQSEICRDLAEQVEKIEDAQDMAMLSDAVYHPAADQELPDENWRQATDQDLKDLGLMDEGINLTEIDGSDFRADVFVHTDPDTEEKTYTIAFKGTTSREDWITNAKQGAGMETRYYTRAQIIGQRAARAQPGKVRFTGHSLGGGQASAASAASGGKDYPQAPATVYNPAGLHPDTVPEFEGGSQSLPVESFVVEGEILSSVQNNSVGLMPETPGRQILLPAPPESRPDGSEVQLEPRIEKDPQRARGRKPQSGVGDARRHSPKRGFWSKMGSVARSALAGSRAGPWGALIGGVVRAAVEFGGPFVKRAVDLHMMDSVLHSLDIEADRLGHEQLENGCL